MYAINQINNQIKLSPKYNYVKTTVNMYFTMTQGKLQYSTGLDPVCSNHGVLIQLFTVVYLDSFTEQN